MKKNKNKILVYIIVAFCVIISGVVYARMRLMSVKNYEEHNRQMVNDIDGDNNLTPTIETQLIERAETYIYVHVCGSVQSPGLVRLSENSRVKEAVDLAGGFTEEADEAYLNLARVLKDGERLYVPSLTETEALSVVNYIGGKGLEGNFENVSDNISEQLLVNINTASASELTKLPGIGSSKATDIINYRDKVGRFGDISEIMNVSGIGPSLFEKIKDFICV